MPKRRIERYETSITGKIIRTLSRYSYGMYLSHFMFISALLKFGFIRNLPIAVEPFVMLILVVILDVAMLRIMKMAKLSKLIM